MSSAEASAILMELCTVRWSLGTLATSPRNMNLTLLLTVLAGGATTVNLTEVLAWKCVGLVRKCRISSSAGLSTLSLVKLATPLTKGVLVSPSRLDKSCELCEMRVGGS